MVRSRKELKGFKNPHNSVREKLVKSVQFTFLVFLTVLAFIGHATAMFLHDDDTFFTDYT